MSISGLRVGWLRMWTDSEVVGVVDFIKIEYVSLSNSVSSIRVDLLMR